MVNPLGYVYRGLDKALLTEYSRIAKAWEDRGHSIYSLSSSVGLPASFLAFAGPIGIFYQENLSIGIGLSFIEAQVARLDSHYNIMG